MMGKIELYKCMTCGNIIEVVENGGGNLVCCGADMVILTPNSTDAAVEKHVPVVIQDGDKLTVRIGSVAHPMIESHYIQYIWVITQDKIQRHYLSPGQLPEAIFYVGDTKVVEVLEYCNIHGLWNVIL